MPGRLAGLFGMTPAFAGAAAAGRRRRCATRSGSERLRAGRPVAAASCRGCSPEWWWLAGLLWLNGRRGDHRRQQSVATAPAQPTQRAAPPAQPATAPAERAAAAGPTGACAGGARRGGSADRPRGTAVFVRTLARGISPRPRASWRRICASARPPREIEPDHGDGPRRCGQRPADPPDREDPGRGAHGLDRGRGREPGALAATGRFGEELPHPEGDRRRSASRRPATGPTVRSPPTTPRRAGPREPPHRDSR